MTTETDARRNAADRLRKIADYIESGGTKPASRAVLLSLDAIAEVHGGYLAEEWIRGYIARERKA